MHQSILFEKFDNDKVRCLVCSHKCVIKPGQTGICSVRLNKQGKLYLLVYGKPSAVNIDPVEKKPLYHFLPGSRIMSIGTVGCNFGCIFCQNWNISQVTKHLRKKPASEKKINLLNDEITKYGYDMPPDKVAALCIEKNLPAVSYTYNEPVIFFEYLYDISILVHKKNIKNVFVTNGFESEESLLMIAPYLDAMNVDLKSFSNEFYMKLCKAKLEPVLETIKRAYNLGIWIEITTLIIPGKNDSSEELRDIADFIVSIDKNIPWHVSAFHPDYNLLNIPRTSSSDLYKAYDIGKAGGLNYIYVGNIQDEKRSSTYCPGCNTMLIKRNGYCVSMKDIENGKCIKCGEKIHGVWE